MEWINKLKLFQKLLVLICIAAFFLCMVGGIGYYFNNLSCNNMTSLYKDRLAPIKDLGLYRSNVNANMTNLLKLIVETNNDQKEKTYNNIKTRVATMDELLKSYEATALGEKEKGILGELKNALDPYRESRLFWSPKLGLIS